MEETACFIRKAVATYRFTGTWIRTKLSRYGVGTLVSQTFFVES